MAVELYGLYDGKMFAQAFQAVMAMSQDMEEGRRRRLPMIVRRALENYLNRVLIEVTNRNSGTFPSGTTANSLSRRTGYGIKSIRDSSGVSGGSTLQSIVLYVGGADYMRIHETGGVIRPKSGKYLTIPLPEALNGDGTPKRRSARDWNDTFIQKSRNGNLLIFQKRGGSIMPLYVLKTSVTIPPRLGLSLTFNQFLDQFLLDVRRKVQLEFMT